MVLPWQVKPAETILAHSWPSSVVFVSAHFAPSAPEANTRRGDDPHN